MQTPSNSPAAKDLASRLPHGEANLTPLAQLKRLQRVLYDRVQSKGVEDKVLAAMACAWERLEGRKAILTMRPAPKPIDVSQMHKHKRKPPSTAIQPSDHSE